MCTLTIIPRPDGKVILGSNRDESPLRPALPPKTYLQDGQELIFPKDPKAGGTWIGLNKTQNKLAVLLNGGFVKHKYNPPYAKSRGLILKEFLISQNGQNWFKSQDLSGVEPFTLVELLPENRKIMEWVWDEKELFFKELDWGKNIWSSSTLYNEEKKKKRREAFFNADFNEVGELEDFHFLEDLDGQEGILIKRPQVETTSFSLIEFDGMSWVWDYLDLKSRQRSSYKSA